MYMYIYINIYIFFKAVIIIMCDFFQVIKNTFFCYANISQPFRYIYIYIYIYLRKSAGDLENYHA